MSSVVSKRVDDRKLLKALAELAGEEPLRLKVAGNCMAPLVREGNVVEISRATFYWPGDVIAFRAPDGRFVLHRLIGYWRHGSQMGLVTQGDECSSCEASFAFDRVMGRVSGGECSSSLVSVPIRHRLRAVGRWLRLVFQRFLAAERRPERPLR